MKSNEKALSREFFKAVHTRGGTWPIMTGGPGRLLRTLDGVLWIVDKTPADLNFRYTYSNPRKVTYREALRFISQYTRWGRRSWIVLQHHGITKPNGPA